MSPFQQSFAPYWRGVIERRGWFRSRLRCRHLRRGFRPDYQSWLLWPAAFDDIGFPIETDGPSTVVDGLHFVGVPFLRKRKSPLLFSVGEDASVVAETIAGAALA